MVFYSVPREHGRDQMRTLLTSSSEIYDPQRICYLMLGRILLLPSVLVFSEQPRPHLSGYQVDTYPRHEHQPRPGLRVMKTIIPIDDADLDVLAFPTLLALRGSPVHPPVLDLTPTYTHTHTKNEKRKHIIDEK